MDMWSGGTSQALGRRGQGFLILVPWGAGCAIGKAWPLRWHGGGPRLSHRSAPGAGYAIKKDWPLRRQRLHLLLADGVPAAREGGRARWVRFQVGARRGARHAQEEPHN